MASNPRSQTGLVPTSHQLRMDRKASPNNYRKLPPRPPPEIYPYKGGIKKRNTGEAKSPLKYKKSPTTRRMIENTKQSNRNRKNSETTRVKNVWDTYITDNNIHQLTRKQKQMKRDSSSAILAFMRESLKHRTQLDELEKKLDYEISLENSFGIFDENNDTSEDEDVRTMRTSSLLDNNDGSASSFMEEFEKFKVSMTKICDDTKLHTKEDNSCKENENHKGVLETRWSSSTETCDKNTTLLHDYLSLQSEDLGSLPDSILVPVHDSSSSAIKLPEANNPNVIVRENHPKDNMSELECDSKQTLCNESMFDDTNCSVFDKETDSSVASIWDHLCQDQMKRIKSKMKEFYCLSNKETAAVRSKSTLQQNKDEEWFQSLKLLPDHHKTSKNTDGIKSFIRYESDGSISYEIQETKNTQKASISSQVNGSTNINQGNEIESCVTSIIDEISAELFHFIRKSPNKSKQQKQTKLNDSAGVEISKPSSYETIPRPTSQPPHPFILPLADDVKETIKSGNNNIDK